MLHIFVHVISDLLFRVKLKVLGELALDLKIILALTSIPDFDEITVVLFVPAQIFP